MDFELDETAAMVQASARDYATKEILPRAATIDREGRIPHSILKGLAELGMMTLAVPEELGGADVGSVAYSAALSEVARACASTAVTMSVTNMVSEVIARFGTDAQKKRYVPQLASGALAAGSFALSEPEAGSDPGAMRTTAEEGRRSLGDRRRQAVDHERRLRGRVRGVGAYGRRRHQGHLAASSSSRARRASRWGTTRTRWASAAAPRRPLHFEGVRVPESALLGELNGGFKIAMMALDGGRIGIASQAIGIAEAALAAAVEYAKERKTFGKPIADHQAIQWMIADARTELDAARLLTYRAAYLKERAELLAGGGDGEALRDRGRRPHLRPCAPDPRRLRLREGVRRGALLPRRARHAHLRGHERDPAHRHRPQRHGLTA
jgi:alkylation response protein AidB-like acyl-CoA dehydrogenase